MAISVPDTTPRGVSVPDTSPPPAVPDTRPVGTTDPSRLGRDRRVVGTRDRNQRVPGLGQTLGVELPDGRVIAIPKETHHLALTGGRALDTLPWSGHPIVIID
jgi:hypothetical protein